MEVVSRIKVPVTEDEVKLAKLWARLLKVEVDRIGQDTTFLEVGGDSISAIQLVELAAQENLSLTTAKIFQSMTLKKMASVAHDGESYITLKPYQVP